MQQYIVAKVRSVSGIIVAILLILAVSSSGCGRKKSDDDAGDDGDEAIPVTIRAGGQIDSNVGDQQAPSLPTDTSDHSGGLDEGAPPQAQLIAGIMSPTNQSRILVRVKFSEPVTGIDRKKVSVVGARLSDVSGSGGDYSLSIDSLDNYVSVSLAEGAAVSLSGVQSLASAKLSWVYDSTPPIVSAGEDLLTNVEATLLGSAQDENLVKFEWSQTSGPGHVTFGAPLSKISSVSADTDGIYILRATAVDSAGNASIDELRLEWDGTAPVTQVTGVPKVASSATRFAATIGGAGVVSYRFKVGPAATTVCADMDGYDAESMAGVRAEIDLVGYPDGSIRLCSFGRDQAGNWQPASAATADLWVKDTSPPSAGGLGVTTLTALTPVSLNVSWAPAVDALTEQANIEYKSCASMDNDLSTLADFDSSRCLGGSSWTRALTSTTLKELNAASAYYVRVAARDAAGNGVLYASAYGVTPAGVHITYYDTTKDDLKYATDVTGAFVISTIDAAGGKHSSLAIDDGQGVHVAYARANVMYYAKKLPGMNWSTPVAVVDAARITGAVSFTSLAVDEQGSPHIVAYEAGGRDLEYATLVADAWTVETVFSAGSSGQYASVALGAGLVPQVSFYQGTAFDLMFAKRSEGSWSSAESPIIVDSAGTTGQWTSIAVDRNDAAHVTYYDATTMTARYASNASGIWRSRTIDERVGSGQYASIALFETLDANSNHVIYYDATNQDLIHAWCVDGAAAGEDCSGPSSTWSREVVDGVDLLRVGSYGDIAIDPQGFIYISYYDSTNSALRYVRGRPGAWGSPITLDSEGTVGAWTSVALTY